MRENGEERREMEEACIKEQNLKAAIATIAKPWYRTRVESLKYEGTEEEK